MRHGKLLRERSRPRSQATVLVALGLASCATRTGGPIEITLAPLPAAETRATQAERPTDQQGSCVLRGRSISRRLELALTPTGRPYAFVNKARAAELTLVTDGSMPLEVDAGGITLSGFATKDDTALFATKPIPLGDAIIPYGWAELRFASLERTGVRVTLDADWLPDLVKGLEEEPTGVAPCEGLSLTPGSFDPVSSLVLAGAERAAVSGEPVLVGRASDEDAALSLWPSPDGVLVARVAARDGDRARIVMPLADVVVYGWVDARQLAWTPRSAPPPPRRTTVPMESGVIAPSHVTCPRSVPVAAEVDDEARFVGHVSAGQVMGLELDQSGGLLLSVEGSGFRPSGLSELRVRSDDLRGCKVKDAHEPRPRRS